MTQTQLQGIRRFYAAVTTPAVTKTAYEMALTSHTLSKDGETARCSDGGKFAWAATQNVWVQIA